MRNKYCLEINIMLFICLILTVVSPDVSSCRQRAPVLVTSSTGYLSSYVTDQTGCGSVDSPWRIRAQPGQKINISLFDFGTPLTSNIPTTVCQVE